jgi:predicted nucleotide-binding protein
VPLDADQSWLAGSYFEQCFSPWRRAVDARFDLFLGYSSQSDGTAKNLKRVLEAKGAKVLDWQDFGPGTILEQIKRAADCCTGGVFLFTADDALDGAPGMAAPRDNVVFEAGYFVHAKGHRRVLVIRESGGARSAKMPADLGGAIYAPLPDLANIEALGQQLDRFVENL